MPPPPLEFSSPIGDVNSLRASLVLILTDIKCRTSIRLQHAEITVGMCNAFYVICVIIMCQRVIARLEIESNTAINFSKIAHLH